MAIKGKRFIITAEVLEQIEVLSGRGLTQAQIAGFFEFDDGILSNIKSTNNEVYRAIKRGQLNGLAKVANKLFDQAMAGNLTAIIFYLKKRDKKNWGDVELDEKFGLDSDALSCLNDEELKYLQKIAQKIKYNNTKQNTLKGLKKT